MKVVTPELFPLMVNRKTAQRKILGVSDSWWDSLLNQGFIEPVKLHGHHHHRYKTSDVFQVLDKLKDCALQIGEQL
jgi:hypothetical protein